jgi:hypothetical protein
MLRCVVRRVLPRRGSEHSDPYERSPELLIDRGDVVDAGLGGRHGDDGVRDATSRTPNGRDRSKNAGLVRIRQLDVVPGEKRDKQFAEKAVAEPVAPTQDVQGFQDDRETVSVDSPSIKAAAATARGMSSSAK